ncbi:hypothetical protein [Microbacterium enclense]|uniref:hypothetical protein n=1 Tax=Microbacterium enclense TaxID=993073 RepID=UPI0034311A82
MNPLDVLWGFLIVVFWLAVIAAVIVGGLVAWCYAADWVEQQERERRAEMERALDRKQAELRRTVLALADALAEERLAAVDASKQMVARAYISTGRVP